MVSVLMIMLAVAIAAFVLSATLLALTAFGTRHHDRIERRLAAQQERMAAQNGRPHTDAVLSRATRRH